MKSPKTLNQILMSGLGRSWMMWGPRNEVKRRCKVPGKPGWYRCELCGQEREKLDVDHIKPVVSVRDGFTTWDLYIESKFVQADMLQGICKDCHKTKTKEENKVRRLCKKLRNHASEKE